jgi:hypothetical protein
MKWANEHGFGQILKDLLVYQAENTNPYLTSDFALTRACSQGHAAFVKHLLTDSRIDPSVEGQSAIRLACLYGQFEVVKVLLADKRVDPSVKNQICIRDASQFGRTEVVKLLLADPRVDPSFETDPPIQLASTNDHSEVVKLLLADERVDPSVRNQASILIAISHDSVEIAKLLLSDRRVIPPLFSDLDYCSSPPSPAMLSLLLLRRSFRLDFQLLLQTPSELDYPFDCCGIVADIEKIEAQRKASLDAHLLVSDLSALCLEYVPDLFCHLNAKIYSLVDSNSDSKFPQFSLSDLSSL